MDAREPSLEEETDSTQPKTNWAHTMISYSGCTTVSDPPGLEKRMEFSRAGVGDVAQSHVVNVWSIKYTFNDRVKPLSIDELEVEIKFDWAKETVVERMQYRDVMAMDGGEDAVAKFAPITHTRLHELPDKPEIGYM
ncbi:hypothetical protein N7499_003249 [Penicillium canescens]|nr:hypothetical protein N7499_003249 [Penicillium canescens]KAJ6174725.1 hypothetical protein N7485_005169 [Penicillium canescens]